MWRRLGEILIRPSEADDTIPLFAKRGRLGKILIRRFATPSPFCEKGKAWGVSVPFGDPQSARFALCLSKTSNLLQVFESSTRKHPHRGVFSLRMTEEGGN
jgi:hypothetical protein